MKCFKGPIDASLLDRKPFLFNHSLLGHPALSIESLSKTIPQIPAEQVMYSKGLTDLGINFDRAHIDHKNGLTIEETIENIRHSNSYIAIRRPETHPSFHGLFADLRDDVSHLIRANRKGNGPIEPMCWMFIASPNAQTPFHFDRYSNFLLQFRGSKEVAVFPNFNEKVISAADCEAYMDRSEQRPPWKPELDQHAIKFHFTPGEAIHIPYISAHYVKNGAEDVSISLSFFFQTKETLMWTKAMQLNNRMRRHLGRVGLTPSSIGHSPFRDGLKANLLPAADKLWSMMAKRR